MTASQSSIAASQSSAVVSLSQSITSVSSSLTSMSSNLTSLWASTTIARTQLQSQIDALAVRASTLEMQTATLPVINNNITLVNTACNTNIATLQSSLATYTTNVNNTILSYLATATAPATRVTTSIANNCTLGFIGGLRYNTNNSKLETCNGNNWVGISLDPLGSIRNPAVSCAAIYQALPSANSGVYYFFLSTDSTIVVRRYCDMSIRPTPVTLGGDGSSQTLASTSCVLIASQFGSMTSVRFLVSGGATNAEDTSNTVRALCVVDAVTGIGSLGSYDGSRSTLPAASCATLKVWFAVPSGVYFINSTSGPTQILCNMTTGNGTSLGSDGSTIALAALNCESIRQHNLATSRTPVSALYFIGLGSSGGPYRAYCQLSATTALNLGGDGTTQRTSSTSCVVIQSFFSTSTAAYFLVSTATADDTSTGTRYVCQMGVTPAVNQGSDGSTTALAAYSCLSAFTFFSTATGVRWLNPSAPFQAYCDNSDGGGWMKILHMTSSTYTVSTGAFGTITVASPSANAKMADNQINYPSGVTKVFKYVSAVTSNMAYVRSSLTYSDTSVGVGIFSNFFGCE